MRQHPLPRNPALAPRLGQTRGPGAQGRRYAPKLLNSLRNGIPVAAIAEYMAGAEGKMSAWCCDRISIWFGCSPRSFCGSSPGPATFLADNLICASSGAAYSYPASPTD
jgi:hypothetical protein